MKRSTGRILTTFAGSLARPEGLLEVMRAREHGQPYDDADYAARVSGAVAEAVRRQVETGVDVVCDGEQGKLGFYAYVTERLGGFEPQGARAGPGPVGGVSGGPGFPRVLRMVLGGARGSYRGPDQTWHAPAR